MYYRFLEVLILTLALVLCIIVPALLLVFFAKLIVDLFKGRL